MAGDSRWRAGSENFAAFKVAEGADETGTVLRWQAKKCSWSMRESRWAVLRWYCSTDELALVVDWNSAAA